MGLVERRVPILAVDDAADRVEAVEDGLGGKEDGVEEFLGERACRGGSKRSIRPQLARLSKGSAAHLSSAVHELQPPANPSTPRD